MTTVSPFPSRHDAGPQLLEEPAPRAQPHVRVITTPPGLPWEQTRAAGLEARSGAALPIDQLAFAVKRLKPWRRGEPGRFAAVYLRRDAVGSRLEADVEADGRRFSVTFLSRAERSRRSRALVTLGGAVGAVVFLLATSGALALQARAEVETRLRQLEQLAAAKERQMAAAGGLVLQDRAIAAERLEGRRLRNLLSDLDWASRNKAPEVRIQAFHWDRGYIAVEVRGEAAPFRATDRRLQRAGEPLRRNVWLWGVEPHS